MNLSAFHHLPSNSSSSSASVSMKMRPSSRRDVVVLGRECDDLLPEGLLQLVVGKVAVRLCSIIVMERSIVHYLQLLE